MLSWIKSFFSSNKTQLQSAVLTTQTITVPVKTKAYHEIVPVQSRGFVIRIYSRKTSELLAAVEEPTLEKAQKQAIVLLAQHNKE